MRDIIDNGFPQNYEGKVIFDGQEFPAKLAYNQKTEKIVLTSKNF